MKKNIIGLMSGTSCDGLDIVYCQFEFIHGSYQYKLLERDFVGYTAEFVKKLQGAIHLPSGELMAFHHEFGDYLGEQVAIFVDKFAISNVDWVASHGHTVLHRPAEGYTFQIGRGENIVNKGGIPVICDFRVQDVVLGGQGAPLVPVGDHYLFSEYDACLNLGGFANVSLLRERKRVAFDISPFNILLNPLAEKLGRPYDEAGIFASQGSVDLAMLDKLNEFDYYNFSGPKSLALEDVMDFFNPVLSASSISEKDKLNTLLVHYVQRIIDALPKKGKVLITGGGAKNVYFMNLLKEKYTGEVVLPAMDLIDFKEAIVFAFLGYLKCMNKVNIFSTVTGASKDHSAGCIFN